MDDVFLLDDWNVANVSLIFMKGDRSLPCTYRKINHTSVVCRPKVIEPMILKKRCLSCQGL